MTERKLISRQIRDGIQLRFAGQAVRIEGDVAFNIDDLWELSESVTDMTIDSSMCVKNTQPRVVYSKAEDIAIEFDQTTDTLHLFGPARNFGRGKSLVYIAEYLAVCTLAERRGDFLTHAAATYDPSSGRSHILFGEKGAGKTTLAIRICKEGGHQIIGNDQVYIGSDESGIRTSGGNGWFNVRRTAIDSDEYLKQIIRPEDADRKKSAWNDKMRLSAEQLGIAVKIGKATVGSIFHIRIDSTQKELHVAPWGGVQQNLIIHERLGRHISGQATPLQDDAGNYLGSLPLIRYEAAAKRRDDLVRRLSALGITEVFAPDGVSATNYILKHRAGNL